MMSIPFIDLHAQKERIRGDLDQALADVLEHGKFIMGPEIHALEKQLAEYTQTKHCISCASGTDALGLYLMAKGLKPGDCVFVPAFTFIATAEVIPWLGAVPFFVDVLPDCFNIDPASLKQAIQDAKAQGLNAKGIIAVDLFGQPANYEALEDIAKENDLFLLDDAAQGFGASYKGKKLGAYGDGMATSFFPAKPLGCYGDGGAIFVHDDEEAAIIRSLRVHGQGIDKYDNVRIGMNGRLDTMQAAILLQKMKIFDEEIELRGKVAANYKKLLSDLVKTPDVAEDCVSVWAQYTVQTEGRDDLAAHLKEKGVPTAIYYPKSLNQQTGYKRYPVVSNGVPVSESLSKTVLSLPMHSYLTLDQQSFIAETIKESLKKAA